MGFVEVTLKVWRNLEFNTKISPSTLLHYIELAGEELESLTYDEVLIQFSEEKMQEIDRILDQLKSAPKLVSASNFLSNAIETATY